ncbi:VOC family protein [Mycobacterium sp.]|jgi:predicted enzyme related to lactoylglutathione lyase|uniref:VOC family protein n=1 Tax=Mycobacterium sp. TaxID=1785 RepID=UPI0033418F29|nr:Glyoxalase/bleomycin resistance protein/dioxygenase [Mycobacterium sp.]
MTNERTYPKGVPCWVDTEQPDLDAARHFYASLFGWTLSDAVPADAPGSYLIASLDGADVAAIGPARGDAPVEWNTYIAVDDADAAAASVCSAGGSVTLAPVDAGPGGRLAACVDPRGARLRLWQPRRRLGAQLTNAPGSWNFSDLHTGDPAAATGFYAPLFGWEFDDIGFATMIRRPGYGDHLAATVDPGIRDRQEHISAPPGFADAIGWLAPLANGHDHWHVTFTVASRDESMATAERLGAVVISSDNTEWTNTALIRDPQGAELTLSQFTPPGGG